MMFLSNNSTEMAKTGQPWKKFELEALESHSFSGKENSADFIQLQTPDAEKDCFVPFKKGVDNLKKTEEAEDILQKAREKAVYIEQEAYEKGFAQGEKDGLELGGKKAAKLIENIESILLELKQLKEDIPRRYEKEILDLIFFITKKIIHREIAANEIALKDTIINALHFAVEKSKVILSVNPEDFEYVNKLRTQFFAEVKNLKSISINSDPSITRGGCLLETPHGDIDSTVETQLKKIYQSMEEAFDE
jgi:flagellar assembly protein FliH